MSMSENHWHLEENYDTIAGHLLSEDFVEAHEIHRELEQHLEDAPSEYDIDRALDALSNLSGNVEILTDIGGSLYDVSSYSEDDHKQIKKEWISDETGDL